MNRANAFKLYYSWHIRTDTVYRFIYFGADAGETQFDRA